MFGFLKNKLKEWVDKAKDTIKIEEKKEESLEEIKGEVLKEPGKKKEKKAINEKKPGKKEINESNKEKIPKKKAEKIKEIVPEKISEPDELVESVKESDEVKQIPVEPALILEPDIAKIKEENLEEKETEVIEDIKKIEEKIGKEVTCEKLKKPGFFKKLFKIKSKSEEEVLKINKDYEEPSGGLIPDDY